MFPLPRAVTLCLGSRAREGQPRSHSSPRAAPGCHPWEPAASRAGLESHKTPARHWEIHQTGPKKWKNDHRKPQKKLQFAVQRKPGTPRGGTGLGLRGARHRQHRAAGKWDIYCPNGSAAFLPPFYHCSRAHKHNMQGNI